MKKIPVLILECEVTEKKFAFNPVTISAIYQHHKMDGYILVEWLGGGADAGVMLKYPFGDAVDAWQEAVNS